jgi:hypothetical protein
MSLLDDEDEPEPSSAAPLTANGEDRAEDEAKAPEVASPAVDAEGESSILPRFREQEEGV